VGVHTTQFAIRDPKIGLLEPFAARANRHQPRRNSLPGWAMMPRC
jgi:hypothetical protein